MHWLGVTRVLRLGGLIADPPYDTAEAQARGTLLHDLTAAWDRGLAGIEQAIPAALWPVMERYQRFLGEVAPRWDAIEHPVQNDQLKVRGVLDRHGVVLGEPAIVDLKFGARQSWHGAQLAGYWWLAGSDPSVRLYGLYLPVSGGRPKLHEYDRDHEVRRWATALRDARFTSDEEQGAPSESAGATEESEIW